MKRSLGMYALIVMWNVLGVLVFLMLLFLPGSLFGYLLLIRWWFG
ncbi:hypothetical protein SAMN02745903_01077 [Pseudomonas sp. URMO17WK12:I5]|nr:hypothetical protein H040_03315 [Pseudomonas sp. URMO17WK12:I7]SMF04986.1 hypothetical protein SAMN02745903_01077 [Pseudomonas sp. URMO17WK12:I5]